MVTVTNHSDAMSAAITHGSVVFVINQFSRGISVVVHKNIDHEDIVVSSFFLAGCVNLSSVGSEFK